MTLAADVRPKDIEGVRRVLIEVRDWRGRCLRTPREQAGHVIKRLALKLEGIGATAGDGRALRDGDPSRARSPG
ncbi:hypothetical protein [Hyphomicrobium sp.]|uniref:hypothetical protein n=1 Tax=Hyphomicrobium sp. TaxID=82 RepID=UPI002FE05E6D